MATISGEITSRTNLIAYLVLVALTFVGLLAGLGPLGDFKLPAVLLVAILQATIGALYFMRLIVDPGPHRWALPFSLVFLVLLGTLSILDLITRFAPTRPDGPSQREVPLSAPERQAPGHPDEPVPFRIKPR